MDLSNKATLTIIYHLPDVPSQLNFVILVALWDF